MRNTPGLYVSERVRSYSIVQVTLPIVPLLSIYIATGFFGVIVFCDVKSLNLRFEFIVL